MVRNTTCSFSLLPMLDVTATNDTDKKREWSIDVCKMDIIIQPLFMQQAEQLIHSSKHFIQPFNVLNVISRYFTSCLWNIRCKTFVQKSNQNKQQQQNKEEEKKSRTKMFLKKHTLKAETFTLPQNQAISSVFLVSFFLPSIPLPPLLNSDNL